MCKDSKLRIFNMIYVISSVVLILLAVFQVGLDVFFVGISGLSAYLFISNLVLAVLYLGVGIVGMIPDEKRSIVKHKCLLTGVIILLFDCILQNILVVGISLVSIPTLLITIWDIILFVISIFYFRSINRDNA